MEVYEVRLFDASRRYFIKKVKEKEGRAYFAGLYGWARAAIKDMRVVRDADSVLTLELRVANPGECIVDFLRDHWGHKVKTLYIPDRFVFICSDCNSRVKVSKEIMEAVA